MGTMMLNPLIYPSRETEFSPFFLCTLLALLRQREVGLTPNWRGNFRNKSSGKIRAQLRDRWLELLVRGSNGTTSEGSTTVSNPEYGRSDDEGQAWVVEIDPDVSGAIAVVKGSGTRCSAQVFDSLHSQVSVEKGMRKQLNPKSMVQIIHSLNAPASVLTDGTVAYIEKSTPFPKDGKQSGGFGYGVWIGVLVASGFSVIPVPSVLWKAHFGLLGRSFGKGWWTGGFGYGVWIGVLVASGFSVIPIPSVLWEAHFGLLGRSFSEDDSRMTACELFPEPSSMFKRKMDHGRAEGLLIVAYGKDMKRERDNSSCTLEPHVNTSK